MSIAILLSAVGFVLYTLVGYPVLLGALARFHRRPVRKAFHPVSISVVIAVRNGERWVARKLASLAALDYPPELLEIFVVSDGSTDGTEAAVRASRDPRVRLLTIPAGGKAAAINAALAVAKGELLLMTDVRQELAPDGLKKLVACFGDPQVGVASGDLVLRQSGRLAEVNIGLYRRLETWIRDRLGEIDSLFGATGAYYVMRRDLAVPIPAGTLLDDMHLPLAAFRRGRRLIMEPAAVAFDDPVALEVEFRRKVRTLAGNYQILRSYPELLLPWRRMSWHFLSYKVARLLLPFALIVIFLSSFGLPDPWRPILLGGQILFYGMAWLDQLVPERWPVKKLTALANTFAVMMLAALCASAIWFVPPERLWTPTGTS